MSVLSDLEAVKNYFDSPRRWTKLSLFRDTKGNAATLNTASCACLMGACMIVTGGRGTAQKKKRFEAMCDELEKRVGQHIHIFNDDPATTFEDIIHVLSTDI